MAAEADNEPIRLRFHETGAEGAKTSTETSQRVVLNAQSAVPEERPRTMWTLDYESEDPMGRVMVPVISEFLGTMIYVLITNLFGMAGRTPTARIGIALLDGATLVVLMDMLGRYGGSHFNPATTLGSILTLNVRVFMGAVIIFIQFFGAFFGALLTRAVLRSTAFVDVFVALSLVNLPTEYPPADDSDYLQSVNRFQVYLLESFLTAFIVLAFLLTSTNSPFNASLPTGIARASTAFIALQSIGQSGNLARLLANNVIAAIFVLDNSIWRLFYLYFFACITGPIIAAIFYWALNAVRLPRGDSTQPLPGAVTVTRTIADPRA